MDLQFPMARQRYDLSSKGAVLLGSNDAEIDILQTRYSLRRSTASKIKDLIYKFTKILDLATCFYQNLKLLKK